ncbi:hypothetical protein CC80DRAFT_282568 [Byssothecium circinans]|uniref:Uncharacterized protein n=1 Tax=Byssothecium circinans TaxID=147558 RepID=A0A6A5T8J8_9PLEO|nr:hypothetical protein CC80DRAFT_282568 [Byssothecium circinans]
MIELLDKFRLGSGSGSDSGSGGSMDEEGNHGGLVARYPPGLSHSLRSHGSCVGGSEEGRDLGERRGCGVDWAWSYNLVRAVVVIKWECV